MARKYLFYREDSDRFRAFLRERGVTILKDFHRDCERMMGKTRCPSYPWMCALYKGTVGFNFQFYNFMFLMMGFEKDLKIDQRLSWRTCEPEILWIDELSKSHQKSLPGFRDEQLNQRRIA